jgi:hypothetical protein
MLRGSTQGGALKRSLVRSFSIIAQVVSVADMLEKSSLLVKVEGGGKRELRGGGRGADRVIKMRE